MSAPTGPRLPIQIVHDEQGSYKVFTGKTCGVCHVQLDSRNRYDLKLLCKEHGREKERERERNRHPNRKARATEARQPRQAFDPDPRRQAVHDALAYWLDDPLSPFAIPALQKKLDEVELNARIRQVKPILAKFVKVPIGPALKDLMPSQWLAELDAHADYEEDPLDLP